MKYSEGQAEGVGNVVLVPALEAAAKEKGVRFDYGMPAVQLVRDGEGPVTGVIAGTPGEYTQYNAKRGVIIATGDYASNQEMVERYSPFTLRADSQIYFPNKCNTGDGHIMAMQIGGAMQMQEPHAAVIHLESGAASYGFLHVNALGKRFKNEDVNTQSKSCTKEFEPGGIAWTVYDAEGLNQVQDQMAKGLGGGLFYGQTFTVMGGRSWSLEAEQATLDQHIEDGKVVTADTLEELAAKMEVPVENFLATVARYNELYEMQDDPDFGKRKELLTPIVKAPFYAGNLKSTVLTMVGGLHTDTSLHVLDANDQSIDGLYVAGSAQGDFFANDYPTICPGIGHGRCITFGRMAGIKAAGGDIDAVIPSIEV
jgi:succinate dehydrogenase/fumarate reductase flavoprotein subunit